MSVVYKITKKNVEEWLGTSNQLGEAIEVIQELANGQYTIEIAILLGLLTLWWLELF